MLQEAGWQVRKDRVQRIWRREGLRVPQKQRPRGRLWFNDGSARLCHNATSGGIAQLCASAAYYLGRNCRVYAVAGSNSFSITFRSSNCLYIVDQRSDVICPSCEPSGSSPATKCPSRMTCQLNCIHSGLSAGFSFAIAACASAGSFKYVRHPFTDARTNRATLSGCAARNSRVVNITRYGLYPALLVSNTRVCIPAFCAKNG